MTCSCGNVTHCRRTRRGSKPGEDTQSYPTPPHPISFLFPVDNVNANNNNNDNDNIIIMMIFMMYPLT